MLGRFVGRILQLLGLVGLPGDLRLWYNLLSAAVPTTLAGIFAYVYQASIPTLVLLVVASYVVFFLASVPITTAISRMRAGAVEQHDPAQSVEPGSESRASVVHTGSIGSISYAENVSIIAAPQQNEPQEEHDPDTDDERDYEADYETRPHFRDEHVYLPLFALFLEDIYVRDRTFTNCIIHGPALISPVLPSTPESTFARNCTFYCDDPDAFLWPGSNNRSGYIGVLAFENCVFIDCEFYRVGLLVKEEDYPVWLEGLRAKHPELVEGSDESVEQEPTDS